MEATLLYALLSLFLFLLAFKFSGRRRNLPPSPSPKFPLIGHLPLLKFPLHRTLHNLSQKLGPIFSLSFGSRLLVVVSSPAIAEECFTKNDIVLANRPRFIIGKYIGYNYASLVAAPYGDYWRNLRRFATIEIFSNARLNVFQSIRQDEIRHLLRKLCQKSGENFATVQLRPLLFDLTLNNIMRMVSGKRFFGDEDSDEAKKFRELKDEVFAAGGVSNPADFFPLLRWVDFRGLEKRLARVAKELDNFLQGLINEHRGNSTNANTMIDHLLSLGDSEPDFYTDDAIKAMIVVMLLGGTDTSSVTIDWTMSVLLNHPDKLDRARAEIDSLIGNDRLINESDISKLPYLQHIITESMRLFPAAPLLVPHETSGDCKIGGYDVPGGTIVLVNAWAIHRDPTVWDDPMSFRPERFEGGEVGTPMLLPFGMGRRSCPGNALAQRVVTATVGALIQCFEWQRVDGEMVDLTEGIGATSMSMAVPLEAMCKARDVVRKVVAGSSK